VRDLIDAISASMVAEVPGAADWRLRKHQPLWVSTVEEPTLYIYGVRSFPGEFRTTGSREDIYEIVVEYHEPATDQEGFERSEQAEADLDGLAQSIQSWADDHQTLGASHRLDYISTDYAPNVRRQLLVRAFQVTFQARKVALYG
jgi:hypothetical protein